MLLAVAEDRDDGLFAGTKTIQLLLETRTVVNRVQVDLFDHVADHDARLFSRPILLNASHVHTIDLRHVRLRRQLCRHVRDVDAQHRALHRAELDEIVDDFADDVHRNGERIARIRARQRDDGRVDAYELADRVHQRAATVARVHRRIRLDERLHPVLPVIVRHRTAFRADNARRDRRTEVVGRADGQHPFAQAQVVRIAQRQGRQVLRIDLDQRDVRRRVRAHQLRRVDLVVLERHFDDVRARDHVVVRHDVAVGTDDHARTQAHLVTRRLREAEEQVEDRVRLLVARLLRHFDVDHRLHGRLRDVREIGDVRHFDAPLRRRFAGVRRNHRRDLVGRRVDREAPLDGHGRRKEAHKS